MSIDFNIVVTIVVVAESARFVELIVLLEHLYPSVTSQSSSYRWEEVL